MSWHIVCSIEEIPERGARTVRFNGKEVAVFRLSNGSVAAVDNRCPHGGGPLAEGIVAGKLVSCPLHGWRIDLDSGRVVAPERGVVARYETKTEDSRLWIRI